MNSTNAAPANLTAYPSLRPEDIAAVMRRSEPDSPFQGMSKPQIALVVTVALIVFFGIIAGIYAAAGSLTKLGPVGGLALGGFAALISIFLVPAFTCGCGILGGGIAVLKGDRFLTGVVVGAQGAGFPLVGLGLAFLTYFIATLICNRFSSLPSFNYTESLKYMGHTLWIGLSVLAVGCGSCYCLAR